MNLREQFEINYELWTEQTLYMSSIDGMLQTPSALQLLSMGTDIIPFIIEKQTPEPDLVMFFLHRLVEGDPLKDYFDKKDCGNIAAISKAWIDWYKDNYGQ